MSVRPIEVQGSYPQSQKAGKIQEQLQQRSQVGQEILAQHQKEEDRIKRTQVNRSDESDKPRFYEDGQGQAQRGTDRRRQGRKKETKKSATHPYKGRFIDITR